MWVTNIRKCQSPEFPEIRNVRVLEFSGNGKHWNIWSFQKSNNKWINIPWKLTGVPGCVRTMEWILTKSDQSLAFGYIELFWQGIFLIYSAFYPLGTLWLDFAEYWKCAQLFAHWVYWSQMAGHIQNVLNMYPLGILESHVDCDLNVFTMYPVGIWALVSSVCHLLRLDPTESGRTEGRDEDRVRRTAIDCPHQNACRKNEYESRGDRRRPEPSRRIRAFRGTSDRDERRIK